MTDQPVSDATGAGYFARLAEFAGTVARWVARAALAGAIGAVCLGVAVWLLILLTDVAPGTVDIGLLFVCLVPAASFIGLWWALRRVVRDVPHFTDDMGQMVGEVRAMPGRLGGALDELQSARGLRARIAALRDAAGLLRGEAETAAARERFDRLYSTVAGIVPAMATVGSAGVVALIVAVPFVLVVALTG